MRLIFGPDKTLRQKSEPFTEGEFGDELEALAQSMLKIMRGFGGVGLAAIQLGLPKRILVGEADGEAFALVNPEIKDLSDEVEPFDEGCLSFPMKTFKIERPSEVTVSYRRPDGTRAEETFMGLAARIVQHEIDHLNGVTILDKISSLKRDIYIRKMKKTLKKYKASQARLGELNVLR